jgi:hypothetical protein
MEPAFEREVRDLHEIIRAWLAGTCPDDDATFAGFADALDADFVIISPRGVPTGRRELLKEFRAAHGALGGDFELWIDECRLRAAGPDWLLGTYEEWQRAGGETTARLSTVLFFRDTGARNGLRWRHLHETWIEGRAPSD